MSEFGTFDLSVDKAWRSFRAALADYVVEMVDTDFLVLQSAESNIAGHHVQYVQFLSHDSDAVSCGVPTNADLDPKQALSLADEARLRELGWAPQDRAVADDCAHPNTRFFFADRPRMRADELATMAVTVLRELWNVPHPGFLRAGTLGRTAELPVGENYSRNAPPTEQDPTPYPDASIGADFPRDHTHLRELVGAALTDSPDHPPALDADGDIELTLDGMPVFVIVHPTEPYVQIWAPLLQQISDHARAAAIVAELNTGWPLIKFVLTEDRLSASIIVVANPFVPRHLTDMLGRMSAFLTTCDDGFVARFGAVSARHTQDPGSGRDGEPEFPAALMAVIDLGADAMGELGARRVVETCAHDRDTILEYIRLCSEQEAEWLGNADAAREDPDQDDLELCLSEARNWSRTVEALLAALRLIDSPGRHRAQGRHRAPDSATESRPRDRFGPTEPTLFDDPS
ncbi:T3SS (YopN, CesT) and YbjN peptide-binding chaperone 1 [Rhodococcus kronopolitis]|uniref:YbjN domain-containing protein n=1 Tax=Rhodococcus kronopolitis TaxID=1460226 RepID=A0ABV9FV50_9NOCA